MKASTSTNSIASTHSLNDRATPSKDLDMRSNSAHTTIESTTAPASPIPFNQPGSRCSSSDSDSSATSADFNSLYATFDFDFTKPSTPQYLSKMPPVKQSMQTTTAFDPMYYRPAPDTPNHSQHNPFILAFHAKPGHH